MTIRRPCLDILVVVLLNSASWPDLARGDVAVESCGTTVVTDSAYLTRDLDCTGHPFAMFGAAITLVNSDLDLRGFEIVTTDPDVFPGAGDGVAGVWCPLNCRIEGPGTISGFEFGIHVRGVGAVSGVTITNSWHYGIMGTSNIGRLRVKESTIVDSRYVGIFSTYVRISDSTIARNGSSGVAAGWLPEVSGSTVVDNGGTGLSAESNIVVRDSLVARNGSGVGAHGLKSNVVLKNSRVENNENYGVWAHWEVFLRDSVVEGNGGDGGVAEGARVSLRGDSRVSGNGAICPGSSPCADLVSLRPPTRGGSASCETSLTIDRTSTWGVCAAD